FLTAQEAGIEDKATLELANIFSSDIDFATDIKEGDSFSLVYEKRTLDGKPAGAGKVLGAKFTNEGKTYTAFLYNDKFYTEDGESLARQFLKSPLNYVQISSGYSYSRENPVTKQVTAHRAIDYAANTGTPVIATADGKVTTAGSKGGLGITVELKHGNYLTQYAHLSRIANGIKNGVSVSQGDTIGYVGSTGISTGPHLQYAMFKSGVAINPLTSEFKREGSLPDSEKESFIVVVNKFKNLLK
ncbi:MAG: peptidoglycan DD-metalloendopeptidase family protein, partial [Minisyncoccia bacterium]